jgi:hypothetical protein
MQVMPLPCLIAIAIVLFPVSTLGQILKSDRQIDGYKGQVRKVVTERADLKMKKRSYVESNRRLEEDIEYDSAGNRIRQLSYDYSSGLLRETAIYKRIDGDKVVVFEETPGAISLATPARRILKKSDPRYDFKFTYKSDRNGNLLEEAWWQSNGDLWLRYVYSYDGDRKIEHVFDAEGKLNQKYVYTFDQNGNLIEEVVYDVEQDRATEKVIYTYLSFDNAGNWTKRSETAGEKAHKFAQKPREVTYRKITYFNGTGTQ